MNKIYKLIWSKAKNCWVVASELAKGHGKNKSRVQNGLLAAFVTAALLAGGVTDVQALTQQEKDEIKNEVAKDLLDKIAHGGEIPGVDATRGPTNFPDAIANRIFYSNDISSKIGEKLKHDGLTLRYFGVRPEYHEPSRDYLERYAKSDWTNVDNDGAFGAHSMALGYRAFSEAKHGVAIGRSALAGGALWKGDYSGDGGVAIGNHAWALGDKSVSVGNDARAVHKGIAIGIQAEAGLDEDDNTTDWSTTDYTPKPGKSIQYDPKTKLPYVTSDVTKKFSAIAIGTDAKAWGSRSTAIGTAARATASHAWSIGNSSEASAVDAIAFGNETSAKGRGAIAIGSDYEASDSGAQAYSGDTIAIGRGSVVGNKDDTATAYNTVAIGVNAKAVPDYTSKKVKDAVLLGANTTVKQERGTAVGANAYVDGASGAAFGDNASVVADEGLAIGKNAKIAYNSTKSIAIGSGAEVKNENANPSERAVAIGTGVVVGGNSSDSIAIGTGAKTQGVIGAQRSIVIGKGAVVKNDDSVAIGTNASTDWYNSVAIGNGAQATLSDGIALGSDSKTTVSSGYKGYDPYKNAFNIDAHPGAAWESTKAALSVGDVGNNITRQITSVAAGRNDTDAVNVAQLKKMRTYTDTKMSSWVLKATSDTGKEENGKTVNNTDNAVTFDVENATQGLKVTRDGATIKYGVDRVKLANYITGSVIENINGGGIPIVNIAAKFGVTDGTNTKAVNLGRGQNNNVTFQGKDGETVVTVGGANDAPTVTVGLAEAFKQKIENGAIHYFSVDSKEPADPAGTNWNNDGAKGTGAVAIGSFANAVSRTGLATAVGSRTAAAGQGANAYGGGIAAGEGTVAIGQNAVAASKPGITKEEYDALREYNQKFYISGNNGLYYQYQHQDGKRINDEKNYNIAIGSGTESYANQTVSLGYKAKSDVDGGVALGAESSANRQVGGVGYIATGSSATFEDALTTLNKKEDYDKWTGIVDASKKEYDKLTRSFDIARTKERKDEAKAALDAWKEQHADFVEALASKEKLEATWKATTAAVSVGKDEINEAGNRVIASRQITNVAAGTEDTDAVNVAQLKTAKTTVEAGDYVTVEKGTKEGTDGTIYTVTGPTLSIDGGNLTVADDEKDGKKVGYKLSLNKTLTGLESVTSEAFKVGNKTYINKDGINANGDKITNVKDGDVSETSTDAVNGKQLNEVKTKVETNEENITELQKGWTLADSDANKKIVKADNTVTVTGDDYINATVSDAGLKLGMNETKLNDQINNQIDNSETVTNKMNSWVLKATSDEGAAAEGQKIDNKENAVTFDATGDGLSVKRNGSTITYGIDGSQIDLDGNTSITNLSNEIEKSKIHYFSVKDLEGHLKSNYNNDGAKKGGGIAIGQNAQSNGWYSIAAGLDSKVTGNWNIAIGVEANVTAKEVSTAIGYKASVTKDGAMAFGKEAQTEAENGISIGTKAKSLANRGIAVGTNSTVDQTGGRGIAIGDGSYVGAKTQARPGTGMPNPGDAWNPSEPYLPVADDTVAEPGKLARENSMAIGMKASAFGFQTTALGAGAEAHDTNTTALGVAAVAKGNYSTALGKQARTFEKESTSVGHWADSRAEFATALGSNTIVYKKGGVALGFGARAYDENSIAIGSNSFAKEAIDGKAYLSDEEVKAAAGIVSVGNPAYKVGDKDFAANYRRIVNVAGGINDNDAVNVAQLKALAGKVTANADNITKGWVLKATSDTGEEEKGKTINNTDNEVTFDVEKDQGLTVTRNGAAIKYGVNNKQLVENINNGDTAVTNISANFSISGAAGADKKELTLGKASAPNIQFLGTTGETTVTVGGTDTAPTVKVGLDEAFKKKVKDNTDNIASNTEKIETLTGRVDTAEKTIKSNTDRIDTAEKTIKSNTDRIDTAEKTIKSNTNRIDTAEKTIKSNTDRIDTAEKTIKSNTEAIEQNKKDIAAKMTSWKLKAEGVDGEAEITNEGTVTFDVVEKDKGLTVERDGSTIKYGIDGSKIDIKENDTVKKLEKDIENSKTTVKAGNENISVVKANDKNEYTITLAEDLKGLKSISGETVNATTVNASDKVTVGDNVTINNEGLTIKDGPSVTTKGIDAGNKAITNVVDGKADTDAVNVRQLNALANQSNQNIAILGGKVGELGNRVNRVGAGAAALAALHPLDFDPDDKWDFAAGYGNYKGANAAAIGAYYRPNEDTMVSVGGSFGGGENMVNAGVSVKLGQGNHVTTSRVAMAKEIKDLRAEVEVLRQAVTGIGQGQTPDPVKMKLFPDIAKNHWAYEAVEELTKQGLLEGYPDGTFGGDRMMTRYEFAEIVYRAMQKGLNVNERLIQEFEPELERFRIDVISKDKNGNPVIERVRVNKKADTAKMANA